MARRKIREFDAKKIIANNISNISSVSNINSVSNTSNILQYRNILVELNLILICPETALETLPQHYPWLLQHKLVVKPDQLFGKRKKLGLVLLNASWEEVKGWLSQHRDKEFTIGKATDKLTHFLIEPYILHEKEYYLAITSERDADIIHFSEHGGIDLEENWDKIRHLAIPTLQEKVNLGASVPLQLQPFIQAVFQLYRDLDFTYLEFNPFTLDHQGNIILLDTVAEVDDCAAWKNQKRWQQLEFPASFGRKTCPEEQQIVELDEQSGASLKLTILNPQGKIWNILSGGGASIIYLDAIANYGKASEIANYGEYSGNPTTEESYQYAKTVLGAMTSEPSDQESHNQRISGKVLFIGGAIANFTDIEKTFLGIVRVLHESAEKLKQHNVSIYVRRGGPNWEKGLKLMKEAGEQLGLQMQVYGPEMAMTEIVEKALKEVNI